METMTTITYVQNQILPKVISNITLDMLTNLAVVICMFFYCVSFVHMAQKRGQI